MNAFARPEIDGEQIASGLVPSDQIRGDDEIDTALLREMAENAKSYITSFSWCETVLDSYFGGGFGGIFAIFFFHIHPNGPGIDPWIWIMLGDVPAAYLPLTDCRSPEEAFRKYFMAMSRWVELAREGRSGTPDQGVPPVHLPATPEWAEIVNQKLNGLSLTVKHLFQESSDDAQTRVQ